MATMMIRTRTRPAAKEEAPAVRTRSRPEAEAPRKLMRHTKSAPPSESVKAEQIKIIENKLQLIAMDYAKIERLQSRIQPEVEECRRAIAKQEEDIKAALEKAKMLGYSDGTYEALFETPASRSTRVFDTEAVFNALSHADFISVVKVQAMEMSKVMNEREIEEVSTVIPGEAKPPVFICRKVPQKPKAKK